MIFTTTIRQKYSVTFSERTLISLAADIQYVQVSESLSAILLVTEKSSRNPYQYGQEYIRYPTHAWHACE